MNIVKESLHCGEGGLVECGKWFDNTGQPSLILLPFGSHLVGLDRIGGLVVQVGIDTIQGFPFYSYIVSAVLGRVRSLA